MKETPYLDFSGSETPYYYLLNPENSQFIDNMDYVHSAIESMNT